MARGNTKFVKYFLEELDKVLMGQAAGGQSANTSILKNYDLPNVSHLANYSFLLEILD